MAAKGSILKQQIIEKILSVFPDSFLYNDGKEIRINGKENGETLQIKVTLTASKTPVAGPQVNGSDESDATAEEEINQFEEPTEEEKAHLKTLLEKLGM